LILSLKSFVNTGPGVLILALYTGSYVLYVVVFVALAVIQPRKR